MANENERSHFLGNYQNVWKNYPGYNHIIFNLNRKSTTTEKKNPGLIGRSLQRSSEWYESCFVWAHPYSNALLCQKFKAIIGEEMSENLNFEQTNIYIFIYLDCHALKPIFLIILLLININLFPMLQKYYFPNINKIILNSYYNFWDCHWYKNESDF